MSSRLLSWTDESWNDYVYWQTQDKKTLKRINKLITDVKRSPFEGIGKPEPLKENLSGFWSRRIDDANRLVYAVDDSAITIISCRYHYAYFHAWRSPNNIQADQLITSMPITQ